MSIIGGGRKFLSYPFNGSLFGLFYRNVILIESVENPPTQYRRSQLCRDEFFQAKDIVFKHKL